MPKIAKKPPQQAGKAVFCGFREFAGAEWMGQKLGNAAIPVGLRRQQRGLNECKLRLRRA
jgi:hypothetical protein